jgi:phosphoserine phosphatase RsbU/P
MTLEAHFDSAAAARSTSFGRRGLARKLVFRIFPILAAIVLLTQLVVGYGEYRGRLEALEARADLVARLTAEAVARPLWALDQPVYESQLLALSRDPAFVRVVLRDADGKVLFRNGSAEDRPGSRPVRVDVPVLEPGGGGSEQGRLELVLSGQELIAGARRQLLVGAIAIAVLLASLSITLHSILARLVSAPLRRLLTAMGRVERKDWHTVEWKSHDEIGGLVQGFNRMVDGLRSGDEAHRLLAELRIAERRLHENHAALARANQRVLDSINYARRIQAALLPDLGRSVAGAAELAVIWEPRDIVGGDLYWVGERDGKLVLVLLDCTGHGVPGAFMTMIAASVLDRVLQQDGATSPAFVLQQLDALVRTLLGQDRPSPEQVGVESDDGLDAAVCVYDPATHELRYAGAMVPLLLTEEGGGDDIVTIRPDRRSLAYRRNTWSARNLRFTEHVRTVAPGTVLYLASDGVIDQLSPSDRLFGRRRTIDALRAAPSTPLAARLDRLRAAMAQHRDGQAAPDDLTLLACRLA